MLALVVASAVLSWADPATVRVEPLTLDPAALRAMPRVEVRVTEAGKTTVYRGVPLRSLLADQLKGANSMADLRALADSVLLVRASDDYQVAVSAAAIAMDKAGDRYLLALERDGAPLGEKDGPIKLIIPQDSAHVRWVRMVSAVDLVRMPKPVKRDGR